MIGRRTFLACACACAAGPAALAQPAAPDAKYVCPPCGCSQDGKVFDKPGVCPDPDCGMQLIPRQPPPPAPPS
jgi:hypothetical protein